MKWSTLVVVFAILMVLGGCKKKVEAPPPPPPPPPAAPTATISANPNSIERGQSTQLTWQTENATEVTIEGLGTVDPSGSRSVQPSDSTTYRLLARGAGGNQEATARVTVTQPPPPPAPAPSKTDEQLFTENVQDIYFDYDSYDIRADQQARIQRAVQFLQSKPNLRFTVEGHCDERGSTEYNLALGDNRANAVKQALVQAGLGADRVRTISYGKEKPFCTESNESCWQENRRGHYTLTR